MEIETLNLALGSFKSLARNTTSYQTRLDMVGSDGPVMSRSELLAHLSDIGFTELDYLNDRLGIRPFYHVDVVCSLISDALLA